MKMISFIKELEKRKEAVGKERDKIEEAISDMEGLKDKCEEAYYFLEQAIDVLSEMC